MVPPASTSLSSARPPADSGTGAWPGLASVHTWSKLAKYPNPARPHTASPQPGRSDPQTNIVLARPPAAYSHWASVGRSPPVERQYARASDQYTQLSG